MILDLKNAFPMDGILPWTCHKFPMGLSEVILVVSWRIFCRQLKVLSSVFFWSTWSSRTTTVTSLAKSGFNEWMAIEELQRLTIGSHSLRRPTMSTSQLRLGRTSSLEVVPDRSPVGYPAEASKTDEQKKLNATWWNWTAKLWLAVPCVSLKFLDESMCLMSI